MGIAERVELALINGKIITMNKKAELAEAVAVSGDKFVRVGTASEIRAFVGRGTKVIDLQGKTITIDRSDTPSIEG